MTNKLKVDDVLDCLNITLSTIQNDFNTSLEDVPTLENAINLIKSQQSRIELLESAIREFTDFVDPRDMIASHANALNKLLEIMENKS